MTPILLVEDDFVFAETLRSAPGREAARRGDGVDMTVTAFRNIG